MAVSPADATSVSEPLYKEEFSRALLYGRNGGITAVTFYDGEAVAAAAYAKGKLREVLEANPWIAGQLVKQALVHLKAGVCIRRRPLVHPKADHKHSPRPSESCRVKSWLM